MAKIIEIAGATVIPPSEDDIVGAAADAMAANARHREGAGRLADQTATQLNLRIAAASLEERAVLVDELKADLDARIEALELDADSILLTDLPEDQDAVRATPAGLATVGIGLLENLSANRATLTYLALSLAGLFLLLRFRSLSRALLALVPVFLAVGASSLIVGLLGIELSPLTTVSGPLVIATCAEFSVLILGRYLEERQSGLEPRQAQRHRRRPHRPGVLHVGGHDDRRLRRADRVAAAAAARLRSDRHAQRGDRPARRARGDAADDGVGRQQGLARHQGTDRPDHCRQAGCADARRPDRGRRYRGGRVRGGGDRCLRISRHVVG